MTLFQQHAWETYSISNVVATGLHKASAYKTFDLLGESFRELAQTK